VAAVLTTEPIRLDGKLDEAVWGRTAPIGPLLQRVPKQLQPPTEKTEVRILYDRDNLYIGIVCHDRDPMAVVSTQLARDVDLKVDDHVTVVLDPFFDQRNGFFFQVNPAGARTDGQISNNEDRLTFNWDGVWDAGARRTEDGWATEIAIPFKTLRFKPGQTTWGFNVERTIKRKQEDDRWASALKDVWISNLSKAGRLTGLEGLQQGRGWELRPYVSGGKESNEARLKGGLDVTKNVTPNLTGVLTVNTDFAETEADSRQVNLTRFPLFFPEKRQFFLEGAGTYDVAGLGTGNSDFVPFFSRRIGLIGVSESQEVPILAGAKLSGRLGNYNLGFLDVETQKVDALEVDGQTQTLERQNLLATRVSRNLFRQSSVGFFATRGNPDGAGDNSMVGADMRLATSTFRADKNLSLDLWVARTDDEATRRADGAFGAGLNFPNDLWDVSLNFKHFGEAFVPALGFLPRAGINKLDSRIAFQPRPGRGGIRQFFFEFEPEYITNLTGLVENWRVFTAPFNVRTESGEHLEWNWIPQFEHLDLPFEIAEGIVIPAGSYRFTRYRVEVNTAEKRAWVVDFTFRYGGFYDGDLKQLEAALTLKPSTHVYLQLSTVLNDAVLPEGSFQAKIYAAKLDYNFSPNVTWANLVQYDSESRLLGAQSRFRWIVRPGNDVFVVLNRGWENREFDGVLVPSFDKGSVKLQYTFRF
jgi:Domain of unknown function (DUF5916)/Carbohydrate family 9 binding domain-like